MTFARGDQLPPAATAKRPQLAGRPFQAASISLIVHPRNPHAPTSHANLRCFLAPANQADERDVWWFGGGFDLTPYYGYVEDAVHWHQTAKNAVEPFGAELYPQFKQECDRYFHLPHRNEQRGIGGLFFDDLDGAALDERSADRCSEDAFGKCFSLVKSVGDGYLDAYLPILERRKDTAYTEEQRQFQRLRRGRYVEFNLLYDRGTRYGIQVGGRTESILASLPPSVAWHYDWQPSPGSEEERLLTYFLQPRDWLKQTSGSSG